MTFSQPAGKKDPPKKDPTTIKTQLHPESQHKQHEGHPRASSSGDRGDCTTETHRSPTIEVHTTNSRSQTDQFKKQKQTRRLPKTGRQRNNLQSNGKEESPERVLNEMGASKLSDTEFKTMVIRKLKDLN